MPGCARRDAAYYQSRALREQGRQGLDYVVRDQPLILGAIGLAVGAAVGALIPNTEAENRLMGETRDRWPTRRATWPRRAMSA
jgi:hypothetical protein